MSLPRTYRGWSIECDFDTPLAECWQATHPDYEDPAYEDGRPLVLSAVDERELQIEIDDYIDGIITDAFEADGLEVTGTREWSSQIAPGRYYIVKGTMGGNFVIPGFDVCAISAAGDCLEVLVIDCQPKLRAAA